MKSFVRADESSFLLLFNCQLRERDSKHFQHLLLKTCQMIGGQILILSISFTRSERLGRTKAPIRSLTKPHTIKITLL